MSFKCQWPVFLFFFLHLVCFCSVLHLDTHTKRWRHFQNDFLRDPLWHRLGQAGWVLRRCQGTWGRIKSGKVHLGDCTWCAAVQTPEWVWRRIFLSSVVNSSLNPEGEGLIFILNLLFFVRCYNLISAVVSTNARFFLRWDGVVLYKSQHFFLHMIVYMLTLCLCSFFNLPVRLVMIPLRPSFLHLLSRS